MNSNESFEDAWVAYWKLTYPIYGRGKSCLKLPLKGMSYSSLEGKSFRVNDENFLSGIMVTYVRFTNWSSSRDPNIVRVGWTWFFLVSEVCCFFEDREGIGFRWFQLSFFSRKWMILDFAETFWDPRECEAIRVSWFIIHWFLQRFYQLMLLGNGYYDDNDTIWKMFQPPPGTCSFPATFQGD